MKKRFLSAPQWQEQDLIDVHTTHAVDGEVLRLYKTEKTDLADENTYVKLADLSFHNGVIELDVCGKLLPDAPEFARGFIGIVFRANEADSEFESFYIRPTNGRDCTDPVRKAHGCQYFSYPGYTFSYFREFGITKYEHTVDTIALGEWSHIRAEIQDEKAVFSVDGVQVLTVEDMKHGSTASGSVGLYVDIGTDGYFKNLTVECGD